MKLSLETKISRATFWIVHFKQALLLPSSHIPQKVRHVAEQEPETFHRWCLHPRLGLFILTGNHKFLYP